MNERRWERRQRTAIMNERTASETTGTNDEWTMTVSNGERTNGVGNDDGNERRMNKRTASETTTVETDGRPSLPSSFPTP